MPGRKATSLAIAALPSFSVRPGETMNCAPASTAASSCSGFRTVPAPTIAPGTLAISRIASSAQGVRSVTSRQGKPPATSASASGTACSISSHHQHGDDGGSFHEFADIGHVVSCSRYWSSKPGKRQHGRAAFFRFVRAQTHHREQFAAHAHGRRRRRGGLARRQVGSGRQACRSRASTRTMSPSRR